MIFVASFYEILQSVETLSISGFLVSAKGFIKVERSEIATLFQSMNKAICEN